MSLSTVFDVENFDAKNEKKVFKARNNSHKRFLPAVGRTSGQFGAVVVHLGVVDHVFMTGVDGALNRHHFSMSGIRNKIEKVSNGLVEIGRSKIRLTLEFQF